ncbi:hypothetical protein AMQ84_24600 [Paenibacillus riograndensis]|uniref:Uncharacterized protein n=1 Tax=Paenibacillus riograndensis TaxID=483937 RepID=A0A132TN43_9BACL|nr:hypothetical protein [Paenibacillus riograndensis]KWX72456.1 hypothetical protein AMQ84_24600 [Paenibacillus riograndensis]
MQFRPEQSPIWLAVRHWSDVAHPLMIGTHRDHRRGGDIIGNIIYENIDILEHHEPQENY